MRNQNEVGVPRRSDVFLCHNSKDKGIIERLHRLLERNRVLSWYDSMDLRAGKSWHSEIEKALGNSSVIGVCLGSEGLGPWQELEIEKAMELRVKDNKKVIPVFLPNYRKAPDIPGLLSSTHAIDLQLDGMSADPFAQFLSSIDDRPIEGRCRPTVLILADQAEPATHEILPEIRTICGSVLQRVRLVDYSEATLKTVLEERLLQADMFVSLLSRNSFVPLGDAFADGLARGARQMALRARVPVLEWRSDRLFRDNEDIPLEFRSTEIKKWQPLVFAREVAQRTSDQFTLSRENEILTSERKQSILGFPSDRDDFAAEIQDFLDREQIRCDAPVAWKRLAGRLATKKHDAIVVILNGDKDWHSECAEWLYELEDSGADRIPDIGAYCQRAEDEARPGPVPIKLQQFKRYFGKKGLAELAARIKSAGGPGQ